MKIATIMAVGAFACTGSVFAEKNGAKAPQDQAQAEKQTRLQIFLDKANFGPGKIDGRDGEFTRKALARYRESQGLAKAEGAAQTEGLDLQSVATVFQEYALAADDLKVDDVPVDRAAQGKLKWLSYESVLEAVAEKFHADVDFIKALNPKTDLTQIKEGEKLIVPNVLPFELSKVSELKPGKPLEPVAEQAPVKDPAAEQPTPAKESGSAKSMTVRISTSESMLEVREGDKLVAAFPVTSGSDEIPTPVGNWKIKGVAKFPEFRYDKKMLKEGERSEDFVMLPPGPNSPVGIMWIALDKKGIGIHGTDSPDTIGRSASHGCVRLANWDVVRLAQLVKAGVPVKIE